MSNIPSIDSIPILSYETPLELDEKKSPIEEKTETISQPIFQAPSQSKGPNVLLKGPGLFDTTVGSGIPDGPSKGGNSGSSGFDGLRSPPDIRDKGSKDPSPQPQQPPHLPRTRLLLRVGKLSLVGTKVPIHLGGWRNFWPVPLRHPFLLELSFDSLQGRAYHFPLSVEAGLIF